MKRTYLDWAAGNPVSPCAQRALAAGLAKFGNPSSPHEEGRAARELLEDARVRIARLASVKADAVLFTAGATEANALAILGQVRAKGTAGTHVLYLPSAHASTRGAIAMLEEEGVETEAIALVDGAIDLARLALQIRDTTVLIALEAACGETGIRFDTRGVWRLVQSRSGSRPKLHVDASQLPLVESFERTRLGADTLALDAQKAGGVRGIGVLIAPRAISILPLMRGGEQERGLRPGTESPALASAFAAALEEAQAQAPAFRARALELRSRFLERAGRALEPCSLNEGKDQAPHILNISFTGRDTEYLAALLNEAGFAVSTKSACATDAPFSVAVSALFADAERARSTLRISWGPRTPESSLLKCADALVNAVRFLDANPI